MFELIVSLDEILIYCQSGERGFEFRVSQSIINVIDIMLQDEDKDILWAPSAVLPFPSSP